MHCLVDWCVAYQDAAATIGWHLELGPWPFRYVDEPKPTATSMVVKTMAIEIQQQLNFSCVAALGEQRSVHMVSPKDLLCKAPILQCILE